MHGNDRQLRGKWFRRGLIRFEVFEPEFELLDVGAHLLQPLAEVHPFEFEDQQTQVLDLGLLRQYECFQRLDVSESRSSSCFLRFASLLTASIPQLCHANLTASMALSRLASLALRAGVRSLIPRCSGISEI